MSKRILPFLLAVVLLLCACAPAEDVNPSADVPPSSQIGENEDNNQGNQENPDPNPNPDPDPDPAPVLNYRNPLNGQPIAEPYTGRPVAVMLNNAKAAMPQHGVSQADILYEVLAEGGYTRCMGIFSDIAAVEKVGSIRSARKYYIQIAQGYGAAYVHFGGSNEALNYLKTLKGVDLDGQRGIQYFVQDKNRLNSGYASEHTWFAAGSSLLQYATSLNYTTSYEQERNYGMNFDDDKVIVGQSVNKIKVYFNWSNTPGGKSTTLTYDKNTKTYFAFQAGSSHGNGSDYIDGNTKQTIAFRNVVVLHAPTNLQSDKYLLTVNTIGSGNGYFNCNGQMVPIKWSRASVNDPFTYTLENGTPLTFGVGSTYVAVVPTGAAVRFE